MISDRRVQNRKDFNSPPNRFNQFQLIPKGCFQSRDKLVLKTRRKVQEQLRLKYIQTSRQSCSASHYDRTASTQRACGRSRMKQDEAETDTSTLELAGRGQCGTWHRDQCPHTGGERRPHKPIQTDDGCKDETSHFKTSKKKHRRIRLCKSRMREVSHWRHSKQNLGLPKHSRTDRTQRSGRWCFKSSADLGT